MLVTACAAGPGAWVKIVKARVVTPAALATAAIAQVEKLVPKVPGLVPKVRSGIAFDGGVVAKVSTAIPFSAGPIARKSGLIAPGLQAAAPAGALYACFDKPDASAAGSLARHAYLVVCK